jgi:hypothetical protein
MPFFTLHKGFKVECRKISISFWAGPDPKTIARVSSRVTRLGEFPPLGRLFSMGSFLLKITADFYRVKSRV